MANNKNWTAVPGTIRPEKEISQKRRIARLAKEQRERRDPLRLKMDEPERLGMANCLVIVQNGQVTPEGRRLGWQPKHLKTSEPFPDLSIPLSKLKSMGDRERGYSF